MSHFDVQKNEFEAGVVLRPVGDHLIVIPYADPETTQSGLFIAETTLKPIRKALVVGVGSGLPNEKGVREPIPVQMYDKVLIGQLVGTEVKVDGQVVLIIRLDDIIAVFEPDPGAKLSDIPVIRMTGEEEAKVAVSSDQEEKPVAVTESQ